MVQARVATCALTFGWWRARENEARRDYEKAVVLDPTNTDLLRDLARLRARCKENDAGDDESATDKAEPTAVA